MSRWMKVAIGLFVFFSIPMFPDEGIGSFLFAWVWVPILTTLFLIGFCVFDVIKSPEKWKKLSVRRCVGWRAVFRFSLHQFGSSWRCCGVV